jgi:hypothetical protein
MAKIGIIGKPNVGKSTFFSALTQIDVPIASYPFTTIKANIGIGYVRKRCAHVELGVQCNPRNSLCLNGTRLLPVELIDVAGLVPGAHEGKGLGNKFLDDLRQADAFIQIVDGSGTSDFEGNPCKDHDPLDDIIFLQDEMNHWLAGILRDGWSRIARKLEIDHTRMDVEIEQKIAGLGISRNAINAALKNLNVEKPSEWSDEDFLKLAGDLWKLSRPMLIAANKCDLTDPEKIKELEKSGSKAIPGLRVVPTSAEAELALVRARKSGFLDYEISGSSFSLKKELSERQAKALDYIQKRVLDTFGSTGLQRCIEEIVLNMMDMICVYPVEDENKFWDKDKNVLPDAYLIKKGSTARDLAYIVHTDLGDRFIRAINCKTKRVVGSDYVLEDGDVIKIVAHR